LEKTRVVIAVQAAYTSLENAIFESRLLVVDQDEEYKLNK
jgi:hypothetical protein